MLEEAKKQIISALSKVANVPPHDIVLETPKSSDLGDLAFPCFKLAPKFKTSPQNIANDLAKKLPKLSYVSKFHVVGPYVNFFLSSSNLAADVLTGIYKQKGKFGSGKAKKERIMIEFSQVNTHKAVHVGHLRNTALGDSLVRVLRYNGYPAIAANYPGDIGTHVAKVLWYMQKYHHEMKKHARQKNKGEWLGNLYAEAAKAVEDHPQNEKEVAEVLQKLESGKDKKLLKLWKQTRQWSLDEFYRIYKELGVRFDVWFFESQAEKPGKQLVHELVRKGIAVKDQGAILIDLTKYNLDKFLILKSDGSSLYATKDLALAKMKFEKHKIDRSVYVVGTEQNLYFKQLFATLGLMGFKQARKCYHLAYELVMLATGKMSSRSGNVVLYSDLASKAKAKALEEVWSRNPKMQKKKAEHIAMKIALAALKYGMLKQAPNKVIIFDWQRAVEFQGDTGPYLQYSLVRANNILKKARVKPSISVDFSLLKTSEEADLIKKLSSFKSVVEKSAEQYATHIIASYAYELTQVFNTFYERCPVAQADKSTKAARALLVWAFAQVLSNALHLLGIEEVDVM